MPRILLAVAPRWFGPVVEPSVEEGFARLGDVVRMDDFDWRHAGSEAARADFAERVAGSGAEVIVTCWGTPILTADTLEKAPGLRYLCHLAGTVRGIVERECIERGLVVTNWGTAISRTIAEASLMMILGSLRQVTGTQFHMHARRGFGTGGARPRSLFERRVGLLGLGAIARELVKLLEPFGCRVEAYSPHDTDEVFEMCGVARQTSLSDLFATNDIVSLHAGLTPETRGMVTRELIASMPDGAVLVNTARGGLVDQDALAEELKTGRIMAALDVYEPEPLPEDSPLRGLENCMLFPHDAGPTDDRKVDMGRLGLRNVRRHLSGEEPEFIVTLERYDLST